LNFKLLLDASLAYIKLIINHCSSEFNPPQQAVTLVTRQQ